MELINFNNAGVLPEGWDGEVKSIYEYSFPLAERRSWQSVRHLSELNVIDAYAVCAGGRVIGLVTIWKFGPDGLQAGNSSRRASEQLAPDDSDTWVYIEHLALSIDARGKGLGSAIIEQIKHIYNRPIVLEAEPAGMTDEAESRLRFYRRLGFEVHQDFEYIQPPYRSGGESLRLHLLTYKLPPDSDLSQIARNLHAEVYGVN